MILKHRIRAGSLIDLVRNPKLLDTGQVTNLLADCQIASWVRRLKDTRGSTLVEFSLVAFMLLMVIFGVVEISRMILVYTDVANAAAEGARYAIVHGEAQTNASQVQTVVKNYLAAAPLTTSNATVNACYASDSTTCTGPCSAMSAGPNSSNAPIGSYVSVCVTYPYDPFTTYFPLNVTLSSTSEGVIVY